MNLDGNCRDRTTAANLHPGLRQETLHKYPQRGFLTFQFVANGSQYYFNKYFCLWLQLSASTFWSCDQHKEDVYRSCDVCSSSVGLVLLSCLCRHVKKVCPPSDNIKMGYELPTLTSLLRKTEGRGIDAGDEAIVPSVSGVRWSAVTCETGNRDNKTHRHQN